MCSKSGLRIPLNILTWRHRQIFWRCCVSFVKFTYWSKFHVNIVTGYGVLTIFVYKRLTEIRKLELRPSEVPSINIWKLAEIRDTKFGRNVSNKKFLNAAKFQVYSFYRFWVIERKPTENEGGRGVGWLKNTPTPRLGLNQRRIFMYTVCKVVIKDRFSHDENHIV